jgi:hypothetical protein
MRLLENMSVLWHEAVVRPHVSSDLCSMYLLTASLSPFL